MLNMKKAPTAFVCVDDSRALGICQTLDELGLTVGVDVSVSGYGNTDAGRQKNLTTVTYDRKGIGELAVEYLQGHLSGREGELLTVKTSLLPRVTTGRLIL